MSLLEIRALSVAEAGAAGRLLGRGMRDNPTHIQAFGSDPARREHILSRMFTPFLRQQIHTGKVFGAFSTPAIAASEATVSTAETPDSTAIQLVGVAGLSAPGHCQPNLNSKLLALPAFSYFSGPAALLRMRRWISIWARHDDAMSAHWHLGPLAVEPQHQGWGIGSTLLQQLCEHLDQHEGLGYLETDKPENVTLYQRFGFDTIASEAVIGTTHWFMSREPRCDAQQC